MKNLTLAALLVIGMASPALASHCPMDMKKIEAAMKTAMLDDAKKNAQQIATKTSDELKIQSDAKRREVDAALTTRLAKAEAQIVAPAQREDPAGTRIATRERGADSPHANFRMISDDKGRVMVVMTHNTDIGDSFEREGEDH